MTHDSQDPRIDLREVTTRNRTARQMITGLHASTIWQTLEAALADTPALSAEIRRLRTSLAAARLNQANLAAAALATLGAYREGEADPLSYLRDELAAQGYHLRRRA